MKSEFIIVEFGNMMGAVPEADFKIISSFCSLEMNHDM